MILVISPFLDDRAGACKHDRVRRGYVPMTVNRDRARSNLCGSRVSEYSCHLLVTRVQNGFLLFERYRPISRLDFRSRGQLSSVSAMTLSMSSLPPFLPNSSSLHHRSNQKQIESNETSKEEGREKEENYSMRNYYNFYSIVSINLSYIMYRLNFHYYGSCYFIPRKKRNTIFHRVNKISEGEKMMKLIFFPKSRFRKWIDH